MHDARAVSNYLIDRSLKTGQPVTALSLLKILYFAHGWYLANHHQPLVMQQFEAWQYGPVNRVVYDQVKANKSRPIDFLLQKFDPLTGAYQVAEFDFCSSLRDFLEAIFDIYGAHHPLKLIDLTHELGSPWDVVWNKSKTNVVPGMLIPNSLIETWFVRVELARSKRHRN